MQALATPSVTFMPGSESNVIAKCEASYSKKGDCAPAGQDYRVARACIEAGAHYIDIADARSFVSRIDVDVLILQRLPTTLFVIGSSQVLALLIALPVGIYAAARPYSIFDQIASTFAFIGFSLPTFFTGILFILIFSIYLDWLPFVYRSDISATGWQWYWEHIRQAIMPVAVLGLFQGASWTRYVRSAVLDVIRLDHVTTARAKGLAERDVIMKHVVRNALIPVVTLVALQMPAVFGGAIVTEQIFRIPGIGIVNPVGVQWKPGKDFPWEMVVVDNSLNADVPIGGQLEPTNP